MGPLLRPGVPLDAQRSSLTAAMTYTLMVTNRKIDDLFRQHRRILQMVGRWFELSGKVQQQSAATAPTKTGLRTTRFEPLTCASDPQRPLCLQMVKRRSARRGWVPETDDYSDKDRGPVLLSKRPFRVHCNDRGLRSERPQSLLQTQWL
jgi:hypothetical protein